MKISEIGQEANLISEFESHRQVDGGYQEESRLKMMTDFLRVKYSSTMLGQSAEEFIEGEEATQ